MANVIAIFIILLMGVLAFYLWRLMFVRGMRRVVAVFRECKALDPERAKTLEELGLQRPPYLRRMFRPRDYKQSASEMLYRQGIIKATQDGRFYLSESELSKSNTNRVISQD